MDISYLLIVIGVGCIILELILGVATGFDLFLVGLTLIVGGGVGLGTGSVKMGFLTTGVLSLGYVVFGRSLIKDRLKIQTTRTNADALLGQAGRVAKMIGPGHPGQVKVEGEVWRAEADHALDAGQEVVVESVSGVTLKVVKK